MLEEMREKIVNEINVTQTFDNFEMQEDYAETMAIATAIIDGYDKIYNPFIIFGSKDAGKTHFLNALANEYHKQHIEKDVLLLNAGTFEKLIDEFKPNIHELLELIEYLEYIDLLLIDDIDLLCNNFDASSVLEYVLSHRYGKGLESVFTMESSPEENRVFIPRLNSLLTWGMISHLWTI